MWSKKEVITEKGMVASLHPQATQAGVKILMKGGNAVDAAITTSLAIGVAEPAMSGLGGRNFAVVYMNESDEVIAIDANVKSSSRTQASLFEPISEVAPEGWPKVKNDANALGYKSICVPGNMACLSLLLNEFGTMNWRDVVEPAINIAESGFHVYEDHIINARKNLSKFSETARIFLKPDGSPYRPGEKICNRDLAATLEKIAQGGADVFYRGEIADAIVKDMEEHGGLLTGEDLASYEPIILEPARNPYRDYEFFYTLGASGGPTLIELLNIVEGFDLADLGHNTPECIHVMAEAMKLTFADRKKYIADPVMAKVPLKGLVSKEYAEERRRLIDPETASKRTEHGDPWKFEEEETTHLSVIDKERNLVSMTQSLHLAFGSCVVITGTGMLMNNMMRRFNPISGFPASIGPNKRPLSYQSPHIAFKESRPFISLGAPGGSRIPTTLMQVVVNIIDHGMGIQEAMDAPKFHCEEQGPITVEEAIPFKKVILDGLKKMGHNIASTLPRKYQANPCGIILDPATGKLHGGVDPRRPGLAAGH